MKVLTDSVTGIVTVDGVQVYPTTTPIPPTPPPWPGTAVKVSVGDSAAQIQANIEQATRTGIANAKFATPDQAGQADVVGVLDVLEHTAYPHELLDSAERCLTPDGVMVVAVPNGPWAVHAQKPVPLGVGVSDHIAVQSIGTLLQLVGERGTMIDAQIYSGIQPEGNSNVCVAYRPRR